MPQLVTARVGWPGRRPIRFWVPVLPVVLVFSPLLLLAVLAAAVACLVYRLSPVRALGAAWRLASALPGTCVNVEQGDTVMRLTIR